MDCLVLCTAVMRRAVAYKSLTRYVQAKQDLEMVLEKEPNNRQALVSILQCLFFFFLSFFLIWGGTCSLRMPALRPASQAGPMRNPREGTSVCSV